MKTLSTTTALRILLLIAAILPFTKANAYDFEMDRLQYNITSNSTVTVSSYSSSNGLYFNIEIPSHVTYNGMNYTVTAIGDSAFYDVFFDNIYESSCYRVCITIPETVTSIGHKALYTGSIYALYVICLSPTPPVINDSFSPNEKNYLYVLADSYSLYKEENDKNHFFDSIVITNGERSEMPILDVDYCYSGPYITGCTFQFHSNENSTIYSLIIEDLGPYGYQELEEGTLSSYHYTNEHASFMESVLYLEALAIEEGKSPSIILERELGYFYPESAIPDLEENFYTDENGIQYALVNNQMHYVEVAQPVYYPDFPYEISIPSTIVKEGITYTVIGIGTNAFKNCINLKSVTLPNTIWYISTEAFAGCNGLTSVTIPNSVTHIEDNAFRDCSNISDLTIGNSVEEIDNNAFLGCSGLTKVSITDLAAWCQIFFWGSDANPLTYAHHLYLNGSEVTDLVIPNTVNGLNSCSFMGCSGLTSVTIPNSVTHIEDNAFRDCSNISDLTIGNSVDYFGPDAFYGCRGLTSIKCYGKVPAIVNYEYKNFTASTRNPEKCREGAKYDYFQGDTCFEECVYQNATLYVPMEAVEAYRTANGWRHFKNIVGFYAYDYVVDGVYYTITGDNEVLVVYGEDAYQGIVSIPETVTYEGVTYNVMGISSGAFAGATLQSLILPLTISNVESGAFDGCHINSLVITGEGNWTAGAISGTIDNMYVMSSVTGIEGLQVNPMTVYSYATVPSTCNDNTFTGYDGQLHVPASSLAAYFTAPYWSNFINITGDAVEPMGITVSSDSVEVLVGNQLTLTATAEPANATPDVVFWTSSDECIAKIEDGVIIAIKAGECDVKAYLLDKTAICHVTVTEIAPTEVILNQEFAKLEVGSQLTLTATVAPDNATDKQVTWASTNSTVATVDSLGHVTAVGQGECFITATCRDKQAMCHVIVVDHFIYISLDEHEVRLMPNHMFTLTPTVSPANTSLVVTSSNPSVAAARMANGKIQLVGIKEGSTLITVNSTDGYAEVDSCLVRVYTLRGDVDCDGFVNITDVTALINYLLSGDTEGINIINADANNDGSINIGDVTELISSLLSGEPLPPKEDPTESSETFTVNGVTFTMVAVEGGTFTMGATPEQGDDALDAEKPAHQVTMSSYAIGETEVTQALWEAVMGSNPSRFSNRPENPVEGVTWLDCQAFIAQLNQLTGKQFRLPTEAEWEYAARGGNKSQGYKYAGSNDINEVAWFTDNSASTQPVGTKKANELGLYDMSGNTINAF